MLHDLTKNGIEKWSCVYCGKIVVVDVGQDTYSCPTGCPGNWTLVQDVWRDGKKVKTQENPGLLPQGDGGGE